MTDSSVKANITYLDQLTAKRVDEVLMGPTIGFTLEQLMELAGLAVAQVVEEMKPKKNLSILVVVGPGNNGGDGLVAARHLHQFGYQVSVCYPRHGKNPHYARLVKQLEADQIPILAAMPTSCFDVIVDAIFGFSFQGAVRDPFISIIQEINRRKHTSTVVSVDVPSGWVIDGEGCGKGGHENPAEQSVRIENPDCVISLTAPKVNAAKEEGKEGEKRLQTISSNLTLLPHHSLSWFHRYLNSRNRQKIPLDPFLLPIRALADTFAHLKCASSHSYASMMLS